ncbi:hypothetical protein NGC52_30570, partial [Klebsiella michiganensis]|nr:hypothetical protein [Klebsiella michiganensis]
YSQHQSVRSYLTWSAIMNMIFELIGLLLVVGCAFFTTFFLAAVAGTMVVILALLQIVGGDKLIIPFC